MKQYETKHKLLWAFIALIVCLLAFPAILYAGFLFMTGRIDEPGLNAAIGLIYIALVVSMAKAHL